MVRPPIAAADAQRVKTEGGDPFEREPDVSSERVFRSSRPSRGGLELDPRLRKAEPGNQASKEAMALGQLVERIGHSLRHQPEIGVARLDPRARNGIESSVEPAGKKPLRRRDLLGFKANRVHDVEPGSPAVQQRGDELGWVLKVSVHHDHRLSRGMSQPGAQGRLMTEVARQQKIMNPRIGPVKLSQNLLAGVGAAVINEDEFKIIRKWITDRDRALDAA